MTKIFKEPLIIAGVTVALLWCMLQFLYFPQFQTIESYKDSLEKNKERNVRIQQLATQSDFFGTLVKKVAEYEREIQSMLPKQIKLSGLLRELSLLAENNNVAILSIRPIEKDNIPSKVQQEAQKKGFITSDIEIVLESNYENLGRYIEAVENNNLTIMAIKNMQVEMNDEHNNPGRLKGILTIEAYYKAG